MRVDRPQTRPTLTGSINHPMFGENLNYAAEAVREDPDGQVADTLRIMGRYAVEDASSPQVVDDARQCMGADELDTVGKVWALTQGKIQFVRDETTAAPMASALAGGEIVEVLIRPRDMAGLKNARLGDCDDYSMYAASMLTALGIPCAFVTVAGDDSHPGRFTHVYVAAYPMGGDGNRQRVAIDASHGKSLGWEVTRIKPRMRVKEWAVDTDMASCDGVGGFGGLVEAVLWVAGGWVAWQLIKGRTLLGV